ncbi:hypothetical protein JCM21900_004908 [Sporobolomyces salmonicolor]
MSSDHLGEALLFLSSAAHVLLAPYTKVEESFTLHAARDLLLRGVTGEALSQYDHVEFAGAVPRSFVGPALLAGLAYPFVWAGRQLGLLATGLEVQILLRLTLTLISTLSLVFLSRRVRAAFGPKVGRYFLLISASQFHVPFWMGRTVPNMIAFPLVQVALALLITPATLSSSWSKRSSSKSPLVAFALLAFAAVILRLELAALIAPFALEQIARGTVGFIPLAATGILVGVGSLVLSVMIDSHFWQRPAGELFWPEGAGFLFNVVEGKASDWGTSPFYTYFLMLLPRLLLLSLPFALFSLFLDRRSRRIGIPSLIFVAIMSGLEHKEWRFIAYVVPGLNVCAAAGVRAVGALSASRRLRRLALFAIIALNLFVTFLGITASRDNYPGAQAIRVLEELVVSSGRTSAVGVHVSPHVAMTGASNFLLYDSSLSSTPSSSSSAWYLPPSSSLSSLRLVYSKSESPLLASPSAFAAAPEAFDYLLVDASALGYPELWEKEGDWKVVRELEEFVGFGKPWRGENLAVKGRKSVGVVERRRG